MNKTNIDKFIPSAKILRNILIIMWSCLVVYLIIKLLGGNWFEIACHNERFINLCNYLDNNFIPRYISTVISSLILYAFLYLAIIMQWAFTKKQFIMFVCYIVIQSLIKNIFMDNTVISFIISFISCFIFPIILYLVNGNKITWRFILLNLTLGNVLCFVFQLISLLIRNIGIKMLDDNLLVAFIFSIDVFIMLILYYLYANKFHQERLLKKGV